MALGTRHIPFLTALLPVYDRHKDDLKEIEQEYRLDINEKFVTFIHKGATPTNPFFLKIRIEDIKGLAELLDQKE